MLRAPLEHLGGAWHTRVCHPACPAPPVTLPSTAVHLAGAVKYLKDPDAGSAPCPGGAPNPGRGAFVHPGTLMGPREVLLLRRHVAEGAPPWAGAAAKLAADTPREYT